MRAASSWVVMGIETMGIRNRRLCLVASRARERHRFRCRSARSGTHFTMERDASHGMISSTPTSVSISTANSARSPLANA